MCPARDWAGSRDLEKLGKRGGAAAAADSTGKEYQRSCALRGTLSDLSLGWVGREESGTTKDHGIEWLISVIWVYRNNV